jgi:uncharacterized pyridoxamine 5'-phosphate oxidase family protein
MIAKDIVRFVNNNPTAFVATVERGKPRVRAMLVFSCDTTEIIFVAGKGKGMCAELENDPRLEVCFYDHNETKTLRIEAAAEFFVDRELSRRIVEKWPLSEMYADGPENTAFVTFRIRHGKAEFWSLYDAAKDAPRIEF